MINLKEKLDSIQKFDVTGFEIVKKLGDGSYGSTYLAKKGDDLVVIKKYNDENRQVNIALLIEREITNLSFVNESRLIIGFRGISFTDLDQEQLEYPLLILDYAENGSLEDLLEKRKSKLDDVEVMIILYGIAKAMQYLHNFNIIHRDLKPGNVLLDRNYYPLLSDFGSSRIIDKYSSNNITPILGTPLYMPLEVFKSDLSEDISMKTDVFSFSMIMYTLLTGKKPYDELDGVNYYKIMNYLEKGVRFKLPDHIPSYFKYLMYLLWDNNPTERPDFSDIVHLFDSGIILDSILRDENKRQKYYKYTKYVSNTSGFDKSNLIRLQSQLRDKENKHDLSFVITFFNADFLNDPDSQKVIGHHYMTGTILTKDLHLGFDYLKRSSDQNNKEALFLLGHAYENGNGCEKSQEKAAECFQKSADLGFQRAQKYVQNKREMESVDWEKAPLTIIIGSISTGKTTLVNHLVNFYDNSEIISTLQPIYSRLCLTDEKGEKCYVRICDSRGMDNNGDSLLPIFCRPAELAIVMFDINKPKTFNDMDLWVEKLRYLNTDARLLIIGNKIDLERKVPKSEIIEKVNSFGADTKYVEISAKKQINIDLVSDLIIQELRKYSRNFDEPTHSVSIKDNVNNKKCC